MANYLANSGLDTGGPNDADTIYNPAHSYSVQHCHDQFASNGDTITLPTGTFTWTPGVTITKAITLTGSSYSPNTSTNCTSPGAPSLSTNITYSPTGSTNIRAVWYQGSSAGGSNIFRLTGIKFTGIPSAGSPQYYYVEIDNTISQDQWRIDNCYFDGGSAQVVMLIWWNNGSGLMDHCTLNGGGASEMVHNNNTGPSDLSGWLDDLTPGSSAMRFMEDNIFQLNGYTTATGQLGTSGYQTYYGARTVARYNLFNFTQGDCHGNIQPNTRWIEFYKNQIFIPSSNTGNTNFCVVRGGSGVIWGNGFASGSQVGGGGKLILITLYTDEASSNNTSPAVSGPQPAYGPGAGIFSASSTSQGPTSSPVYLWANDTNLTVNSVVGTGGWSPTPIVLNSNYFISTTQPSSMTISEKASQIGGSTYSYSPYTYPHPLTGLSNTPGSGLTAVADASITRTVIGVTSGAYSPPGNNYFACFSSQFTSATKGGATEWSNSVNTNYARVAMGTSGAGWSIAAYSNGTGVVWNNLNAVATAGVVGANQSLFALGFCDSATIGGGNINIFIDLSVNLAIDIGQCAVLPAGTGAIFTSY